MGELGALGNEILCRYAEYVKIRDLMVGNFDTHLRMHFEVFPYVYIGKPCICTVSCPRTHELDDLYQIQSELEHRVPVFIVWVDLLSILCGGFQTFLLSVWSP